MTAGSDARFEAVLTASMADTVAGRLAALDAAMGAAIGHKLFTVLVLNWDKGENQRYYSNMPEAYKVGGAKPIAMSSASLILEGQCQFLDTYEDVKAAFFDHELIRSLGCESCVNIPVRWDGKTIGMVNLLHQAHWYKREDVPLYRVFGALAAPALLQIIASWGDAA